VDPVGLSTQVTRELLAQHEIRPEWLDHIVWGTVVCVTTAPNVAREIALDLNLYDTPGYTLTRACATGLQTVANATEMILSGRADTVVAGGVDMASFAPVPHHKKLIDRLLAGQKGGPVKLLGTLATTNPTLFFPQAPTITERYTGRTMGQHAEEMAQFYEIGREAQDEIALASHRNAAQAIEAGHIDKHRMVVASGEKQVREDNLIRPNMNPEKVASLRPVFDRENGTVTAASSSAITDGASAVLVMSESKCKELGLTPMAWVRGYGFSAHDPRRDLLMGNAHSIPRALKHAGVGFDELDLFEIHEAFAAQLLCNLKVMADEEYCSTKLGLGGALGEVARDKLNIWGGSLAFGHPFAATGGRLLTQLAQALPVVEGRLGVASACAAGGLGGAVVLERAS
jgi:acetyl-CoA acyltransferase